VKIGRVRQHRSNRTGKLGVLMEQQRKDLADPAGLSAAGLFGR